MSIFNIVDRVTQSRRVPVYYMNQNKIYYKSKYVDNYVNNEVLFDGTHDSMLYGYDTAIFKKVVFTNNQLDREMFYG